MHDNLHWLYVPERAKYKVIILPRRCLVDTTPRYLAADCVPVSEMAETETPSTLRRWSSARRAVLPSELPWPWGFFCTRSKTAELFA